MTKMMKSDVISDRRLAPSGGTLDMGFGVIAGVDSPLIADELSTRRKK